MMKQRVEDEMELLPKKVHYGLIWPMRAHWGLFEFVVPPPLVQWPAAGGHNSSRGFLKLKRVQRTAWGLHAAM